MMALKNVYWTSVIRLVLGVILLAAVSNREVTAERPSLERPDPNGVIDWTRKIYENGNWNATPDIAHWRGHYYVCINQGMMHNGADGPGIVLRSSNLKDWEQIYTTTGPPANGSASDCKLLALPDRLIFYYLYYNRENYPRPQKPDDRNYVETRAVYTDDGQSWSKSQRVYEPLQNFWKPKVHNGVIYVASDYVDVGRTDYILAEEEQNPSLYRIDLLSSTDGLNWKKVSTILNGNPNFSITETALAFRSNGDLWAYTRQNLLSRSAPPYTDWTNQSAEIEGGGIGGPEVIAIGSDVYLAGRFLGYLKNHGPPESPQTDKHATSLWKYGKAAGKFERIADLPRPSYADVGYNGFVATEGGVFMVYYSGHDHGETDAARSTKADIFLSKLKLGE